MMILFNSWATGLYFSIAAITLNFISNLTTTHSFLPLFFLQLLFQIADALSMSNQLWKQLGVTFMDFGLSQYHCLDGQNCYPQLGIYLGISTILIATNLCIIKQESLLQSPPLTCSSPKTTFIFWIFFSIFEWIQVPIMIAPLYILSGGPSVSRIVQNVFCLLVGTTCIVTNYVVLKKISEWIWVEKVLVHTCVFLCSLSIFVMKKADQLLPLLSLSWGLLGLVLLLRSIWLKGKEQKDPLSHSPLIQYLRVIAVVCEMICFTVICERMKAQPIQKDDNNSIILYLIIVIGNIVLLCSIKELKHKQNSNDMTAQTELAFQNKTRTVSNAETRSAII